MILNSREGSRSEFGKGDSSVEDFSVAGGNGSDTYGGADPERQKGTFGLMPGQRQGRKRKNPFRNPKLAP